jgi:ShK domain-like
MNKYCPVSCRGVDSRMMNLVENCNDYHNRCKIWAELGECAENADMRINCAKSCDLCLDSNLCVDYDENCALWADSGGMDMEIPV